MQRLKTALVLCLVFVSYAATPQAQAESIAAKSCSAFKEAKDPKRQAVFLAFLEGQANATNHDPRYVLSETSLDDDAKKLQDWCAQNPSRTFGEAVTTVLSPNYSPAAPAKVSIEPPPVKKPPPPPPPAPPPPSKKEPPAPAPKAEAKPPPAPVLSCKVGRSNYCAGCDISCEVGQQALCTQGKDNEFRATSCAKPAQCICK